MHDGLVPAESPQVEGNDEKLSQRANTERVRLSYALLLSLLIHMLLLSLTLGGRGLWFPGFSFPWEDRRTEVPDLRVALVPAQVMGAEPAVAPTAESLQQADVATSVSGAPVLRPPSASDAPTSGSFAAALTQETGPTKDAKPAAETKPPTEAKPAAGAKLKTNARPRSKTKRETVAAPDAAPAKASSDVDQTGDAASRLSHAPEVIAVPRPDEDTWVMPNTPATPPPVIESTTTDSNSRTPMTSSQDAGEAAQAPIKQEVSEAAVDRSAQDEQRQAQRLEAARQEALRQEATRIEAARGEAARVETARVESARIEAARVDAERNAVERAEAERVEAAGIEAARVESARIEAARAEAARIEAARIESARAEAARVEAARIESARAEAARIEAARIEAARAEAARVEAARIESARAEAARIEAARIESARAEAARIEAARIESARAEAARIEAARIESARADAARNDAAPTEAQQAEARREERLRAIGRQLDEEAARREAATAGTRVSPSWGPARRYRLLGRTDPNEEIILYAEAWSQKIQMNVTSDMVREVASQRHTDPLVWVAIRSDGSVESVKFVQSSGVPAIDDTIRRIVDSTKPYRAFPPALARDYDVIEIRRTWHFDVAIRLY